mgnify:FL=1
MILARTGLWQEVVNVPAVHTFLMPEGMSFEEAAALPVNYITAYMILFDFGNLRPNQSVLIHMAAGKLILAEVSCLNMQLLCRGMGKAAHRGARPAKCHLQTHFPVASVNLPQHVLSLSQTKPVSQTPMFAFKSFFLLVSRWCGNCCHPTVQDCRKCHHFWHCICLQA